MVQWKTLLCASFLVFSACAEDAVKHASTRAPIATMPMAPQMITLETARYHHLITATTLRWSPYAGQAAFAAYKIYEEKGAGTEWRRTPEVTTASALVATIQDVSQRSYTIRHDKEPESYSSYRVYAVDANGRADGSNTQVQTGLHLYQRSISHAAFHCPAGIHFKKDHNVLISDTRAVYEFTPRGTFARTFGASRNTGPYHATEDRNGNVLVLDWHGKEIARYDTDGQFVSASAANGPGRPHVMENGAMVVPLYWSKQIAFYEPGSMAPTKFVGGPGSGPLEFNFLWEVWGDATQLFALDINNDRVQVLDLDGNYRREFANTGEHACRAGNCSGMTLAPEDLVYLVSTEGILVYGKDGSFTDFISGPRFAQQSPWGTNFSPAGELYLARCDEKEVMIFGP